MSMSRLLRFALIADAAATSATALSMLLFSSALESLLGIPSGLLWYAGLGLLPYAALVAYLGTRVYASRVVLWVVIAGSLAWAVDSVLLLTTGWIAPTFLGYAFVIAQAVIVAIFAELQYVGLRNSSPAPQRGRRDVATA